MAQKIFEDIELHGDVKIKQSIAIDKPINGVKVYRAVLTQSGTDAPVATVLENTLGDISFIRGGVGQYQIQSSGLFTANKTFQAITVNAFIGLSDTIQFLMRRTGTSTITIDTYRLSTATVTASDEELTETPIEIRVYE